jgi:hypothetical protein
MLVKLSSKVTRVASALVETLQCRNNGILSFAGATINKGFEVSKIRFCRALKRFLTCIEGLLHGGLAVIEGFIDRIRLSKTEVQDIPNLSGGIIEDFRLWPGSVEACQETRRRVVMGGSRGNRGSGIIGRAYNCRVWDGGGGVRWGKHREAIRRKRW